MMTLLVAKATFFLHLASLEAQFDPFGAFGAAFSGYLPYMA